MQCKNLGRGWDGPTAVGSPRASPYIEESTLYEQHWMYVQCVMYFTWEESSCNAPHAAQDTVFFFPSGFSLTQFGLFVWTPAISLFFLLFWPPPPDPRIPSAREVRHETALLLFVILYIVQLGAAAWDGMLHEYHIMISKNTVNICTYIMYLPRNLKFK